MRVRSGSMTPSEGRDGVFVKELFSSLKHLTDGLVAILYVKSALDRLDDAEQANLKLLDEMFDGQLFAHLVVVLTHADVLEQQDGEDGVEETIEDHQQRGLSLCSWYKNHLFFFAIRAEKHFCPFKLSMNQQVVDSDCTPNHLSR